MLIASIPHYPRTLKNIDTRYNSLVSLSKTLAIADRIASDILDGLPKEEQDSLRHSNRKLLNAVSKGINKYETIINNLYKALELASQNKKKLGLKVTKDKIILDFRKLNESKASRNNI